MLQFIGLANYFRDHVPKYQRTGKLIKTIEGSAGKLCQQELYLLEDTATPILQTDASDFGIGGYLYMMTNGEV